MRYGGNSIFNWYKENWRKSQETTYLEYILKQLYKLCVTKYNTYDPGICILEDCKFAYKATLKQLFRKPCILL